MEREWGFTMDKHKLKDFIDATKEEAGNVAVEEVLPAVVKEVGSFVVSGE